MRLFGIAVILISVLVAAAFANGPEEAGEVQGKTGLPFDPNLLIAIASAITFAIIGISIYLRNRLPDSLKKAFFIIIIISVSISTLYLAGATVLANMSSVAGGPVHWHADFDMWICGQKILLLEPKNLENRVGTPLLHHHNEGAEKARYGIYRIHVEGVVSDPKEINLGHFFEAIGGHFSKVSIIIPQKDGSVLEYKNGDLCPDGTEGTLKMYVNGELNQEMDEYVMKPYSNVPPGDFIRIAFGSLPENSQENSEGGSYG